MHEQKSREGIPVNFPRIFASGIVLSILVTTAAISAWAQAEPTVVEGYVLDSACAFVKNLKKPISSECAMACAKAGSALVILADDEPSIGPFQIPCPPPVKTSG
jgi:hypothetical protein